METHLISSKFCRNGAFYCQTTATGHYIAIIRGCSQAILGRGQKFCARALRAHTVLTPLSWNPASAPVLSCHKCELQSVVGLLHDASIVITPGCTFLWKLIDLIKSAHHCPSSSFILLNLDAWSDILWWHTFIDDWNGLSMMQHSQCQHPDIVITSIASGSWDCGAYYGVHWLHYPQSSLTRDYNYNITAKELLPIVLAAAVWREEWGYKSAL